MSEVITRVNPLSYARPVEPRSTFEIVDSLHNVTTRWTLRKLSPLDLSATNDAAIIQIRKYILGGSEDSPNPLPFEFDGEPVHLSEAAIRIACMIQAQCVPQDGAEPYSFEELILIAARMPSTWMQLTEKAGELQEKKSEIPAATVSTLSE